MDLATFHDFVKKGDLAAVKAALALEPALLSEKSAAGQSAFVLAKYYRQPDVAAYLLAQHPDFDIYEYVLAGALAAVKRELNMDERLLAAHNPDGWTLLHLAAFFGQPHIAEALLDLGADVDARSTNRMANTPLHAAAAGGQTGLVELLLKRGADPNARQLGGWTALHAAAQSGHLDMLRLLLAHAADPQARAENNQTPFDLAMLGGKAEIVDLLEQTESPAPQRIN